MPPSAYWRDDADAIGTASIAGEAFHFESDSLEAGRRKVVQRFPGSDFVRGQDVGPGERALDISGYLIGGDYHLKRDRMIAVFEDRTDKVLIHPYYGQITVTIEGKLKIAQTKDRLGRCSFSFRCIKVPPTASRSSSSPNLADLSALGASVLRSTATPALAAQVTQMSTDAPFTRFKAAVEGVQSGLEAALAGAQSVISVSDDLASQVEGLTATVTGLAQTPVAALEALGRVVGAVVAAPMAIASATAETTEALTSGERVAAMLGMAALFRSPEGPALPTLTDRAIADEIDDTATQSEAAFRAERAVTAMLRVELVATMIEQLAKRLPESREQAEEALAEILAAISGVGGGDPDALIFAVDQSLREQITRTRTAVVQYLSAASITLPELRTYEVPSEMDALEVAWVLYGDAGRWEEIVRRNGILHAGLIPAGTVIEYIEAA